MYVMNASKGNLVSTVELLRIFLAALLRFFLEDPSNLHWPLPVK